MKVYGAIAESTAEDAPLLHTTNTLDADKKPFKGAALRKKTISALAVAGVAACGVVAIAAKGSSSSFGQLHNNNAPSSSSSLRLGDALDDAKAGTTFVPICVLISLSDSIRTRPNVSCHLFSFFDRSSLCYDCCFFRREEEIIAKVVVVGKVSGR